MAKLRCKSETIIFFKTKKKKKKSWMTMTFALVLWNWFIFSRKSTESSGDALTLRADSTSTWHFQKRNYFYWKTKKTKSNLFLGIWIAQMHICTSQMQIRLHVSFIYSTFIVASQYFRCQVWMFGELISILFLFCLFLSLLRRSWICLVQ